MMLEDEAVLMRPEQLQATGLTAHERRVFLDGLAALLIPMLPYFLWRPVLRDADDDMVLEGEGNVCMDDASPHLPHRHSRESN